MFAAILITLVVLTGLTTEVSADAVGIYQLCLDKYPDGSAQIEPAPGQPEILILFKGDQVWLHSMLNFVGHVLEPNQEGSKLLFTRTNGLYAPEVFPKFPTGRKFVVSFAGLSPDHPFYNSILVFHNQEVLRYRVIDISLARAPKETGRPINETHVPGQEKSGTLKVILESAHSLTYWPLVENDIRNIKAIYTIRGTRILIMLLNQDRRLSMFMLNRANLGGPLLLFNYQLKVRQPFGNDLLFRNQMADGKELAFLRNGLVCFQPETCVQLKRFVSCETLVEKFRKGFAYWLHNDTEMTLRLISLGLVAAHLMCITMGFVYAYNQMNRLLMLT